MRDIDTNRVYDTAVPAPDINERVVCVQGDRAYIADPDFVGDECKVYRLAADGTCAELVSNNWLGSDALSIELEACWQRGQEPDFLDRDVFELDDLAEVMGWKRDDAFGKFEVVLTPAEIEFEGVRSDVLVSEQDTAGLSIDDQVFFSGLSHDELAELAGKRDTGLDFTVLSVGEPFTELAEPVFPGDKGGSEAVADPTLPRGEAARTEREGDER